MLACYTLQPRTVPCCNRARSHLDPTPHSANKPIVSTLNYVLYLLVGFFGFALTAWGVSDQIHAIPGNSDTLDSKYPIEVQRSRDLVFFRIPIEPREKSVSLATFLTAELTISDGDREIASRPVQVAKGKCRIVTEEFCVSSEYLGRSRFTFSVIETSASQPQPHRSLYWFNLKDFYRAQ